MLLNLVETSNANTKDLLWKFVKKNNSNIKEKNFPIFDKLIGYSIKFFNEEDSQICKNGLIHHLNNFKIPAIGNKKQGIFEKFFNIFSN